MSRLSFLEKLLDGAEVEWKPLGELAKLRRGRVMSKTYFVDNVGNYPVYSSQTANNGEIGKIDTFDFDGEFISWTTDGANAGTVFYRTGKFSVTNVCGLIKIENEKVLSHKYLYYWLTTEAKKHVYSGMGNPKLMSHQVEKISVPIPCPDNPIKSLEIQFEIVRILDAFTELTTELATELNARKKQYNYYKSKLLNFDKQKIEWKTLREVGVILRGTAITEKETNPGKFPVVANGPSHNYYHDQCNRDGETIVVARSGAYAGLVSYWNQPIFLTDAFSIHPENKVLCTKFLYYVFKNNQEKIHLMSKGAGVPHVRAKDFETYIIPVPSLEKQESIVAILDKFDTLTNSTSEGLPGEIALRQKQFEYYRNMLFSFPKAEENEA